VESYHESIRFPAGLYSITRSEYWSGFEGNESKVAFKGHLNKILKSETYSHNIE